MNRFRVLLAQGHTVEVEDSRFSTEFDLERHIQAEVKSPRWVRIGRLVTFSQNIIGVEALA